MGNGDGGDDAIRPHGFGDSGDGAAMGHRDTGPFKLFCYRCTATSTGASGGGENNGKHPVGGEPGIDFPPKPDRIARSELGHSELVPPNSGRTTPNC